MESNYSFRPATLDDVSRVALIETQVQAVPWSTDHFQSELSKPYSHFLVLTDDETDSKIAGYIVCWMMFDECQILNLAVDLPFRGLGFAKQMIRKSVVLANNRGIKRVNLEVRKSNMAAIQLYQGLGFLIRHIRKKFYENGEDAYQMVLSLQQDEIQF